MAGKRRAGRRPGHQPTRELILAAAREAFARRGYDATSVREIAAAADVDPALVHHYFGTKEKLFLETVSIPFDPRQYIHLVVEGPREELAERLLTTALGVWDSPSGLAAGALLRGSLTHQTGSELLREFLLKRALEPLCGAIEPDPVLAKWRMNLVATQLMGLAMMRYVLAMEPLASASPEQIVDAIGPNLQRYLTGDLHGA
ncbi:TetR/AcrR family transcriptional regulator [Rhodococcus sp. D2-41]|uniref:TetR family transcriptional regulator n=1 Tax=Speluncibacter jeojiensis TaxID=2710754 RepID=A0A9X4M2F4_9ACTN|nr:TetR family transcriptional regulator [Rhodococcus sp. D2-41]MDG3010635.1 TetR/AcrR family transcriptional regulator [Rhodococcus sp. D2-41]MDG3016813.1 TetR family transcriptional regulator [Corynebacteriales bacterium D3-21]